MVEQLLIYRLYYCIGFVLALGNKQIMIKIYNLRKWNDKTHIQNIIYIKTL